MCGISSRIMEAYGLLDPDLLDNFEEKLFGDRDDELS